MTKQELLKDIHEIIWRDDDSMEQDTLSQLQGLIDCTIIENKPHHSITSITLILDTFILFWYFFIISKRRSYYDTSSPVPFF